MDPLAQVVTLLQPGGAHTKLVTGAGQWTVRQPAGGHAFFCAVLDGGCYAEFDGHEPMTLNAGDFVLIPASRGFTMSSVEHSSGITIPMAPGEKRFGTPTGPSELRMMGGYFLFGSPDAELLVSLIPRSIHVQGEERLRTLVALVRDESRHERPGREMVITRLLEVLLIEALRSSQGTAASPGLLRGLSDPRLSGAIRELHEHPAKPWTVADLAKIAALSRSTFFERFSRVMGISPMEYLLAWRMSLAKDLLRRKAASIGEVAERVGYASASTFSTAFSRYVGLAPTQYAAEA